MKGNVKFFNEGKGFGFIAAEDGNEYFVHISDLDGVDARDLKENTAVIFTVTRGDRGPKAAKVKLDKGDQEAPESAADDSEEDPKAAKVKLDNGDQEAPESTADDSEDAEDQAA